MLFLESVMDVGYQCEKMFWQTCARSLQAFSSKIDGADSF